MYFRDVIKKAMQLSDCNWTGFKEHLLSTALHMISYMLSCKAAWRCMSIHGWQILASEVGCGCHFCSIQVRFPCLLYVLTVGVWNIIRCIYQPLVFPQCRNFCKDTLAFSVTFFFSFAFRQKSAKQAHACSSIIVRFRVSDLKNMIFNRRWTKYDGLTKISVRVFAVVPIVYESAHQME